MKVVLCLILALGYLAYTKAMPTESNQNEEDKNGVTFDIDPSTLLSCLEAIDSDLALKIVPNIFGTGNSTNPEFNETAKIIKDLDHLIEKNQEISIKVDQRVFISFLGATDPQFALKILPKILGKTKSDDPNAEKKIFRLY